MTSLSKTMKRFIILYTITSAGMPFILALILQTFTGFLLRAQTLDDGIRLADREGLYFARRAALGTAYYGVSDDLAAIYTNPAGLTLLPANELSFGFQVTNNKTTSDFLGTSTPWKSSSLGLSHLGAIFPLHTRTPIVFGLSYAQVGDFSSIDTVSAFNPSSSIVQSWVAQQQGFRLSENRAWRLFIADTVRGRFISPIVGNLQQGAYTQQSGGIHSLAGSVAFDVGKNVGVGLTLAGLFGQYQYQRSYSEADIQNRYDRLDVTAFTNIDFAGLSVAEYIRQDISALQAIVGVQLRIDDSWRCGFSLTTPFSFTITETSNWIGRSTFDNGETTSIQENYDEVSYRVVMPWVLSAGVSGHISGLTLSGGGEYSTLQNIEFLSDDPLLVNGLAQLSSEVSRSVEAQYRYGVGAEYEIPETPVVVRGSYSYSSSPLRQSSALSSINTFAMGLGLYASSNVRIDISYLFFERSYQVVHYAYSSTVAGYDGTSSAGRFAAQVVYRW